MSVIRMLNEAKDHEVLNKVYADLRVIKQRRPEALKELKKAFEKNQKRLSRQK